MKLRCTTPHYCFGLSLNSFWAKRLCVSANDWQTRLILARGLAHKPSVWGGGNSRSRPIVPGHGAVSSTSTAARCQVGILAPIILLFHHRWLPKVKSLGRQRPVFGRGKEASTWDEPLARAPPQIAPPGPRT